MLGLNQTFINDVNATGADVQIYTSGAVVNYSGGSVVFGPIWQVWQKPSWARCVWISAGGGGAAGGTGANTGGNGGGGEGGSGSEYRCGFYPAIMLPDILYIQIGQGGQHPTSLVASTTGPNGAHTYVSFDPLPNTATVNTSILLMAGGGNNSVGAVANSTAGAQQGAAAGMFTNIAMQPRSGMGIWIVNTSFSCVGTNGGPPANAGENPGFIAGARTFSPQWCGGGGGGSDLAGTSGNGAVCTDSVLDSGISRGLKQYVPERLISQAASGGTGATPAKTGDDGFINRFLWQHYGGNGGGGSSNTLGGVAGAGGNGILGSGGGGGGGCTTTVGTLPRPGNGGDGFVMIMSW